jgi:GNAT superfamily N-acetyltransferase
MIRILSLTPAQAEEHFSQLCELLVDAVDSGASVGFLPPLSSDEAAEYWRSVIGAMRENSRVLLAAVEGGDIQGSVQMALEMRANGNHRAEVMKLFVHRRARRRGLAKALVAEVESTARLLGRTLLIMDTRKGSEAEQMLHLLGYSRFGEVPGYARSANGKLHTTSFFYRQLT